VTTFPTILNRIRRWACPPSTWEKNRVVCRTFWSMKCSLERTDKLMKVILISGDGDLYKLCREILNEFKSLDFQLTTATPQSCARDADLYIWDGYAKTDFPAGKDHHFPRHLFLIPRSQTGEFQEVLNRADGAVLLKPITQASLTAFLSMATSTFHERL